MQRKLPMSSQQADADPVMDSSEDDIDLSESEEDMEDPSNVEERSSEKGNKFQQTKRDNPYTTQGGKSKRGADFDDGETRFKVQKLSKTELYKPPTNEEINRLRETENLFHSTLFRMEITELLAEVKLKEKRKVHFNKAFETLKAILSGMKPGQKLAIDDLKWLIKCKIKLPIEQSQPYGSGHFQFLPPGDVRVTGSYFTETCVKPDTHMDVVVVMPKETFSEKDYLNHRYSHKRALYLCSLAKTLTARQEVESLQFYYHHDNHLKPVLRFNIKVEGHKSIEMHLHVVPETDSFKLSRFHVNKNNVRARWFYQDNAERQEQTDMATPYCNSTVLEDLCSEKVSEGLQKLQSYSVGVKDGLVLLKLWLRQRDLDKGPGGFSGFLMSMYVLYLLFHKKLSPYMSSYQVMRNTLLRLSQSDWTCSGITLCRETSDIAMPTLSDFHKHFDVVFVDKTGYLNFCYGMNRTLYSRVVHEAKLSVAMLDDKSCDSFDLLFMTKVPFCLTFDHIFHIRPDQFSDAAMADCHKSGQYVDHNGRQGNAVLPSVLETLHRGLGTRVTLLQVQQQSLPSWDVTENPPEVKVPQNLIFGLLLDAEHAHNVLDRGPSADTAQAVEFRHFWGERSELRRFHGGGICEAVLWTDKTQSVCEQIVRYIMDKHVGIKSRCITYLGQHLDHLLTLPVQSVDGEEHYGMGDKHGTTVNQTLDELGKMLHKLDDMPLTISAIQGVSPCFRYTEVFPPLPCSVKLISLNDSEEGLKRHLPSSVKPCPWYMPSLKVVCTLESSGKWPDDLDALQRLKSAFYIQLAKTLRSRYKLPVWTRPAHIDILKDHYVFRIELACLKEISLLKTVKMPEGMVKKRDTPEALELERNIVALPKMASILHGLHQQQTAYGPSVRLAKRWVNAHLLGDYIHPMAIELLVAHLFLVPAPHTPPRSACVGFLRFLHFLSKFDWKTTPLMVNLNNEFTDEDKTEIPTRFSKERSSLPLMFISTPQNKFSSYWTQHFPTPPILQRLVLLAQKSLGVLQGQMLEDLEPDFKLAFRPSFAAFDVLIHLKQQQIPRQYERLDITEKTYMPKYGRSLKEEDRFPVVDYDPVQLFLLELRESFEDLCLFFYDPHGGTTIGVLWKPNALQKHDFKVSHINHSQPLMDSSAVQLTVNVEAFLEDIAVIGKGLVKSIEVMDKVKT